ncbi:hypothetical protein GCM10027217_14310 [Pseudomaricurvus hydrocarbonicus]
MKRGDKIAITGGKLVIEAKSGKPVPIDWLKTHKAQIINEILRTSGLEAYEYLDYTANKYTVEKGKKSGGVHMSFRSLKSGKMARVYFNVNLTRQRNTKHGLKGSALPKGHFWITKNHDLYNAWLSLGLPPLKRLSSMHDYMGHFGQFLYNLDIDPKTSKIIDKKLKTLEITAEQLRKLFLDPSASTESPSSTSTQKNQNHQYNTVQVPDNCRTTPGQLPDNCRTTVPDNDLSAALMPPGLQPFSSTYVRSHELSNQGNAYTRDNVYPLSTNEKSVQDQTLEEWLDAYNAPDDFG